MVSPITARLDTEPFTIAECVANLLCANLALKPRLAQSPGTRSAVEFDIGLQGLGLDCSIALAARQGVVVHGFRSNLRRAKAAMAR